MGSGLSHPRAGAWGVLGSVPGEAGKARASWPVGDGAGGAGQGESAAGVYGTSADAFVNVFGSAGSFVRIRRPGGSSTDHGQSVATDSNNRGIVVKLKALILS